MVPWDYKDLVMRYLITPPYIFPLASSSFTALVGDDDKGEGIIIPLLSAGHFNITSRQDLQASQAKYPILLVGFSSSACHRCLKVEKDYQVAAQWIHHHYQVVVN